MRKFALLTFLVMILASCQEGIWMGDPTAPSVVVIGDSITYGAEDGGSPGDGTTERHLTEALVNHGFHGYVSAYVGGGVRKGYEDLWHRASRLEYEPDILVIALGTNDAHNNAVPLEESRSLIHAWLAEAPDSCIRLIGVNEHVPSWQLDLYGPPFNAMLAEEASLHPNATVVPWDPDPSWFDDDNGPHPNTTGDAAYRDLLVSAAESCTTI